jgi:hypothetical protein
MPDPEEEVNVVEGYPELLIKPSYFIERAARHHHASSGHSTTVAHEVGKVEIAWIVAGMILESVTGHSSQPQNHSSM